MLIHRDSLRPSCRRAENQNWRRKRELSWKPPATPVPAHCRHVTGVRPHLVLLRDISWGTDICAIQAGHHQQIKETVVPGVAEQAMTSLDLSSVGSGRSTMLWTTGVLCTACRQLHQSLLYPSDWVTLTDLKEGLGELIIWEIIVTFLWGLLPSLCREGFNPEEIATSPIGTIPSYRLQIIKWKLREIAFPQSLTSLQEEYQSLEFKAQHFKYILTSGYKRSTSLCVSFLYQEAQRWVLNL